MPNCPSRVISGKHGHDGGNPQFGQPVRMRGGVGRQIDREPGIDCRSNQAPVLDSDSIVAEDGLVGEGDDVLAGVGGDELFKERTVDRGTISRQVAGLRIPPETPRLERRDFGAELPPGPACQAAGHAIPIHGEGAGFGVAAVFVERAARSA
jgi:hypothetical protein